MSADEITIGFPEQENNIKTKNDNDAVVNLDPQSLQDDIIDKLSDDEKEKLKTKKTRKKKEKKEEVSSGDNWKQNELTDDQKKESLELLNSLSEFLNKKAGLEQGSGLIETLPTGIDVIDAYAGGGFGCGTFSIIVGKPGTFKSSLLAQIIANSQRKFAGKLLASYADSEQSMTKMRLKEMGVKHPPIKPYPDITVEDIFKMIEGYCTFKELNDCVDIPSIIAWDSIANTVTDKERNAEKIDHTSVIGLKAKILSVCLPKYISKMREYNTSLIAINQLRDKIDMGYITTGNDLKFMGMNDVMPGGQAIKYNAFHLLLLASGTQLKHEQWGFDGIEIKGKFIKNKLFTPNIPFTMIVNFKTGISNFWTNYKFMVDNKVIKTGAWANFIGHSEIKWNGTKTALEKYNTEPEFKQLFDEMAKKTIQEKIIDRYTDYQDDE